MMVGRKKEIPYKGHTIPQYTVLEVSPFLPSQGNVVELLTDQTNIDLRVHESSPHISPLKSVGLRNLLRHGRGALVAKTMHHPCPFFRRKERGGIGEIIQGPERDHAHHDSQQSLQNENPTPALVATDAIHFGDGESEETAECPRYAGSLEEESLSHLHLFSNVPLGQKISHAGKETGSGHSQEEAGGEQSRVVVDRSHARHDDSPCDHDAGQPYRGTKPFEQEIAGWLEYT